jgi:hypothetical protein
MKWVYKKVELSGTYSSTLTQKQDVGYEGPLVPTAVRRKGDGRMQ